MHASTWEFDRDLLRLAPQKYADYKFALMHAVKDAKAQWGDFAKYTIKVAGDFLPRNGLQTWLLSAISQEWVLRNWYTPFVGDQGTVLYHGSALGCAYAGPTSTFPAVARGMGVPRHLLATQSVGPGPSGEAMDIQDSSNRRLLQVPKEISLLIMAPLGTMNESLRWSIITCLVGLLRDFEYQISLPGRFSEDADEDAEHKMKHSFHNARQHVRALGYAKPIVMIVDGAR